MKRRRAREAALRIMFQIDISKCDENEAIKSVIEASEDLELDESLIQFAKDIVSKTVENIVQIDTIIANLSKDWSVNRLSPVDRSILRLAMCEISFFEIPLAIAIDEALEISKKYCDYDAPKFINGILGKYAEQIKRKQD